MPYAVSNPRIRLVAYGCQSSDCGYDAASAGPAGQGTSGKQIVSQVGRRPNKIAAASPAPLFCPFKYALTNCGARSQTSWPARIRPVPDTRSWLPARPPSLSSDPPPSEQLLLPGRIHTVRSCLWPLHHVLHDPRDRSSQQHIGR